MKTKIKALIEHNNNKIKELKAQNDICKKLGFGAQIDANDIFITQIQVHVLELESLLNS